MVDVTDGGRAWPGEGLFLAGRYRLVEFVAYGGTAALWRAHDSRLDRDVALKVLLPHHRDDEAGAARFRREAQAIAHVRHPNMVPIFDVVVGRRHVVSGDGYVDGPVLSQFRGHAMGSQMVAAIGYQVAAALGVAHEHDLVHRDVKAGNIMVDVATGRAKLLDFEVVKSLHGGTGVTGPRQGRGHDRYAAPEQVSDRPVGPWPMCTVWDWCCGSCALAGLPFRGLPNPLRP